MIKLQQRHLMNIFKQVNNTQCASKRFASSKLIFQPRKPSLFNPKPINSRPMFNPRPTSKLDVHFGDCMQKCIELNNGENIFNKGITNVYSGIGKQKFKPMSNSKIQNINKTKPLKESVDYVKMTHKKDIPNKVMTTKPKKDKLFLEKNDIQFSNNMANDKNEVPTLTEFFSNEKKKHLGSDSTNMWPSPNSHLKYINNMRKLENINNDNGADRYMNNTYVSYQNKSISNPSKLYRNNSKMLSKSLEETVVKKYGREKKKLNDVTKEKFTLKRNHDLASNKIDNNENKGPLISKQKKKYLKPSGENASTIMMQTEIKNNNDTASDYEKMSSEYNSAGSVVNSVQLPFATAVYNSPLKLQNNNSAVVKQPDCKKTNVPSKNAVTPQEENNHVSKRGPTNGILFKSVDKPVHEKNFIEIPKSSKSNIFIDPSMKPKLIKSTRFKKTSDEKRAKTVDSTITNSAEKTPNHLKTNLQTKTVGNSITAQPTVFHFLDKLQKYTAKSAKNFKSIIVKILTKK